MSKLIVKQFTKLLHYEQTWQAMREFTDNRNEQTIDELWLLEHPPVFTQGQAGKAEHILNAHSIPIVQTDRGGQVTYHGPGQLVAYTLFDINRMQLSTRGFVRAIEKVVIDTLAELDIDSAGREDAPGIYVGDAKICSIGLRVRRGRAYHGIAFNIEMDLKPFSYINPCGFTGLKMTQVKDLSSDASFSLIQHKITHNFVKQFGYNQPQVYQHETMEQAHDSTV